MSAMLTMRRSIFPSPRRCTVRRPISICTGEWSTPMKVASGKAGRHRNQISPVAAPQLQHPGIPRRRRSHGQQSRRRRYPVRMRLAKRLAHIGHGVVTCDQIGIVGRRRGVLRHISIISAGAGMLNLRRLQLHIGKDQVMVGCPVVGGARAGNAQAPRENPINVAAYFIAQKIADGVERRLPFFAAR